MPTNADSPLASVASILLRIFAIGLQGEVGRPRLTLAWQEGAEASGGVHVGLDDATDTYLHARVADEVGIVLRSSGLGGEPLDDVFLSAQPVTFLSAYLPESLTFAKLASGRGLDVISRAEGPAFWSRIAKEHLHILRARRHHFRLPPMLPQTRSSTT